MVRPTAQDRRIDEDEHSTRPPGSSGARLVAQGALDRPNVSRIDGATHYAVAVAYEQLELPDDAIYEFHLAADDPAYAFPSWRSVGRLQHERERWNEAARAYQRAILVAAVGTPEAKEVNWALKLASTQTPLPPSMVAAREQEDIETLDSAELVTIDDDAGGEEPDPALEDLFS